jgi:hypothetical protein
MIIYIKILLTANFYSNFPPLEDNSSQVDTPTNGGINPQLRGQK